jgi:hypothetical protein
MKSEVKGTATSKMLGNTGLHDYSNATEREATNSGGSSAQSPMLVSNLDHLLQAPLACPKPLPLAKAVKLLSLSTFV